LNPQDRVVVAGVLRAIPGQKVDPQIQAADAAAAASTLPSPAGGGGKGGGTRP
jgi:hypothetical protein